MSDQDTMDEHVAPQVQDSMFDEMAARAAAVWLEGETGRYAHGYCMPGARWQSRGRIVSDVTHTAVCGEDGAGQKDLHAIERYVLSRRQRLADPVERRVCYAGRSLRLTRTKRMVARYEFCKASDLVTELQWIKIKTAWTESKSRMLKFQATLTEVAFDHEQCAIVRYLVDPLAPASFKAIIATKLPFHKIEKYKMK
ncbi:hypothetical protein L917_02538 [Phytophthora nicotianae]|nr:hypothetical protein L915_02625 [Phytophthora nicotianae]ETL47669.1 hypothetical protein L916_02602 [Phytophthora nicotianae]ETM00779.1 hypothetical protein L917_02538 [Phytophthora nicotianae]